MSSEHRVTSHAARSWEYLSIPFDVEAAPMEAQIASHARGGWELVLVAPPRYGSLTLMMHFRRHARSPLESPRNHT